VLAVGNDDLWRRLCRVIGLVDLADDVRFKTNQDRVENYERLRPMLADQLKSRTREEWIRLLQTEGVPCGSVRDVAETLQDPHLSARQMIEAVEHATAGVVRMLGIPIKLSETPGAVRTAPPTLGQHTDQILRTDLGLTQAEVARLREEGAV
jgi:crotonobetainyl-CoA:carnitine CoA-transferase CaiB-like acyl-CoA transferase